MATENCYCVLFENGAQELLNALNLYEIPVPVDEFANRMGILVLAFDLGKDVSSLLHVKRETASTGYNPSESKVRQRFTIVHELGHYVLYKDDSNVIIDNGNYFTQVKFRSSDSTEHQRKQEANAFAATVLIPKRHSRGNQKLLEV